MSRRLKPALWFSGAGARASPEAGADDLWQPHREVRRATFRRWLIATTLGELLGFSVPTAAWAATEAASLDDRLVLVALIGAGAGEGAVLALAQSRALRRDLPGLEVDRWVGATAAAAALAWAIGMTPSAFADRLAQWPGPLLGVSAAIAATVLLCSIGFAQALVLRRHVEGAGRWVLANALGWLLGLPVAFAALAAAPDEPAARAAVAVLGGLGMGLTVAAVTGVFLVRLLERPRTPSP